MKRKHSKHSAHIQTHIQNYSSKNGGIYGSSHLQSGTIKIMDMLLFILLSWDQSQGLIKENGPFLYPKSNFLNSEKVFHECFKWRILSLTLFLGHLYLERKHRSCIFCRWGINRPLMPPSFACMYRYYAEKLCMTMCMHNT